MLLHILSEEDPDYPLLPTHAYYAVLKDNDDGVFQDEFYNYTQKGLDYLKDLTEKATAAGVETEYSQLSGLPGWGMHRANKEFDRQWSEFKQQGIEMMRFYSKEANAAGVQISGIEIKHFTSDERDKALK